MEFPSHLGSIKFPIINCIPPTISSILRANVKSSGNCNRQNIVGSKVPSKAPIVGIKFRSEIKNAQNMAKFNPKEAKTI